VEVAVGSEPKVIYGKVSPDRARKIMQEHVVGGKVVAELVLPA
jgi:(2Fe-2S) ferredoxin